MFTGESKAGTPCTFNKQTSEEQLKNMSKQLVMKFMLHLHKMSRAEEWMLTKIKQSKPGLPVSLQAHWGVYGHQWRRKDGSV